MIYQIKGKTHRFLNQAIKEVGVLSREGYTAIAIAVADGQYCALLDKKYKTEIGAQSFVNRYEGRLELEVLRPKLEIK